MAVTKRLLERQLFGEGGGGATGRLTRFSTRGPGGRKTTGASPVGIIITGVKEIDEKLKQFDIKTQKKHLRKATRAAAKIVLEDARKLVPHDTGALEKSLRVRAVKRSRRQFGHGVFTGEGLFKGEQFYGGFVELGTKKMEADPYLRPALYGNEQETLREFRIAVLESIDEAARSAAAGDRAAAALVSNRL